MLLTCFSRRKMEEWYDAIIEMMNKSAAKRLTETHPCGSFAPERYATFPIIRTDFINSFIFQFRFNVRSIYGWHSLFLSADGIVCSYWMYTFEKHFRNNSSWHWLRADRSAYLTYSALVYITTAAIESTAIWTDIPSFWLFQGITRGLNGTWTEINISSMWPMP